MECTQQLDYESQTERICPEQIGFLGILGNKYPIKRGPNKVGRDPQTCSIVLNLNSISRQHGVINILNNKEFMLMDLDSANKTKLNNKTLQAYIPVPLSNGDTIQFGDVFGIFRLLEEEYDLPATQALDIPDTPVMRRTKQQHQATIPESPDISDRDEAFVMPSQPIPQLIFHNPRYNLLSLSKTASIQLSCPKDSLCQSSENSISLDSMLNDSDVNSNISEVNTQALFSDDSFLMPSQPAPQSKFRSPCNKLIELSKTTSLQSSSSKIENNTWSSSRKSTSLNLDDSLNDSGIRSNIHEAETQAPFPVTDKIDDSIYEAATQISEGDSNNLIFCLETQLPQSDLPAVCKVENQHNVEIDIFAANKENQYSIYNADTQMVKENDKELKADINDDIFNANTQLAERSKENHDIFTANTQIPVNYKNISSASKTTLSDIFTVDTQIPCKDEDDTVNNNVFKDDKQFHKEKPLDTDSLVNKVKVNESDDDILLEELDCQPLTDDFLSQPILSTEQNQDNNEDDIPLSQSDTISDEFKLDSETNTDTDKIKPLKRTVARIESDSQSDCEDFNNLPTQKLSPKAINEDDLTDCEDDSFDKVQNVEKESNTILRDMVDGVKPSDLIVNVDSTEQTIEDLATQIIPGCDDVNFEDMPTQVLEEEGSSKSKSNTDFKPLNIESPFKIPQYTPLRMKRKDVIKSTDIKTPKTTSNLNVDSNMEVDDDKYYAATQEIFDDLCSQKDIDDIDVEISKKSQNSSSDNSLKIKSPVPRVFILDKSLDNSDGEEKVNDFVSRLSVEQINDVIGVEISKPKKVPSDPSDGEVTPKKVRPFKFLETELPNSQEIKTSVTLMSKSAVTESSSDSETEIDSQENTPVVFRKKKRVKNEAKKDLFKDFDLTSLPTRIITRTRKPTAKIREGNIEIKEQSKNILKPKFLTEQDEEVDSELISENINKLRSKTEKKNNRDHVKSATTVADKPKETNDSSTRKAVQKKTSSNKTNKSDSTTSIDLTAIDNKIDNSSMQTSSSKSRPRRKCQNLEEKNNKTITTENLNRIDHVQGKPIPSDTKTNEPRKSERSAKKNVQGKITNYTVATASNVSAEPIVIENDNLSNATKRTTRQRSKNAKSGVDVQKNTDKSIENVKPKRGRPKGSDKKESKTDSLKTNVTHESKKEVKHQEETQRSKRQRAAKSNNLTASQKHEQSTVYSLSSESSGDSPKGVKRTAAECVVPASKRVKTLASLKTSSEVMSISSGLSSSSSSRRSTPSRGVRPYHVLFTAFPGDQVKEKLEKLGAVIVGDASSCSVAVTQCIRRTVKLLCAVGLGRPVVGPAWVQACVDNQTLVDPWQYILKDEVNEKRFQFNLEETLSGPRNYLKGYNLSSTPTVMPSEPEMKQIVECSGGTWRSGGSKWLAISCRADAAMWPGLRDAGAIVVSSELVLAGVLKQRLIVEQTKLC